MSNKPEHTTYFREIIRRSKEMEIELSTSKNVLVENLWLSVDPYMRARMTEKKNYKEPFKIGEPMEGAAVGIIKKTNSNKFNIGDHVLSNCGWRNKFVEKGLCNGESLEKLFHSIFH